ncbi:hypothetical protein IAR55_002839 [Kwoniella newhampshirensis]|uniref:Uncharacterized protein n=1 Tax=Kwoniella newhampshirensis TaxID=1651941 RepID=A0AAW0Z1G0_9TREE
MPTTSLLLLAVSLLVLSEARPNPLPLPRPKARPIQGNAFKLVRRQTSAPLPVQSTTSQTQTQTQTQSEGNPLVAIVIPIIVIVVVFLLLGILLKYRTAIIRFFPRLSSSTTDPTTVHSRTQGRHSSRTLTAADLSRPNLTTDNAIANGTEHATRTSTRAGGRTRRGSRRNHLRRTESGRSVRTLPVYSKEAGDEELVLVRKRSNSSFSDDSFSDGDDVEAGRDLLPIRSTEIAETVPAFIDNLDHTTALPASSPDPSSSPAVPVPQSAPPFTTTTVGTSDHIRSESMTRRGWGEAPTYLEAMSSPSFNSNSADEESGPAVPPPRTLRTRTSSTFRGLLSRAGFAPSAFNRPSPSTMVMSERQASQTLLLQPSTSRLSSAASSFHRGSISSTHPPLGFGSPYGPGGSPFQSTHSLIISSPIPDTAVRASFETSDLPRAGLNEAQMQFLSSREAVNLAGVKLGDVPDNRKRRRGSRTAMSGENGDEGPPSWEQSEETRRRSVGERPGEGNVEQEQGGAEPSRGGVQQPHHADEASGVSHEQVDDMTSLAQKVAAVEAEAAIGQATESSMSHGSEIDVASTPGTIVTPHFEVEPPTPVTSAPPSRVQSMLIPLTTQ